MHSFISRFGFACNVILYLVYRPVLNVIFGFSNMAGIFWWSKRTTADIQQNKFEILQNVNGANGWLVCESGKTQEE